MKLVTEDAESAAYVKVGSNNQNPTAFHLSQAPGRIEGFVAGREPESGTDWRRLRPRDDPAHSRTWAGQQRQRYIFSPANDASSSDSAALQPHSPAAAISPAETCDDARTPLPRFRRCLGICAAIPYIWFNIFRCLSDFNLRSSCVY